MYAPHMGCYTACMQNDHPKRKPLRLKHYDYSSPGVYFITICTAGRRCFLSTVGAIHESPAPEVNLTQVGKTVKDVIESLPQRYPTVHVDTYVIMPNHIHLLLRIEDERAVREPPLQSDKHSDVVKRSLLAKAIGYIKMNSSRQIHTFAPDLVVWQRAYYDHVVRDEKDYGEVWAYIEYNPLRWSEDSLYAE